MSLYQLDLNKQQQRFQLRNENYNFWLNLIKTKNYVPIKGEICGIIITKDDLNPAANIDNIDDTLLPLPSGYREVQVPFSLLKMGNGELSLSELPWVTGSEQVAVERIVSNLLTQDFTTVPEGKEDAYMPSVEGIKKAFIDYQADWDELDINSPKFINNKICYNYQKELNEVQNVFSNLEFTFSNIEDNIVQANNLIIQKSDFNIENIKLYDFYNFTFNHLKSFSNLAFNILDVDLTEGKQTFLYCGNPSYIWTYILNQAGQSSRYLNNNLPFLFYYNYQGEEIVLHLIVDKNLINIGNKEYAYINLSCNHTHELNYIKTIDSQWLPNSVYTQSNYNETNYLKSSYIQNKPCFITDYKIEEKDLISNKIIGMTSSAIGQFTLPHLGIDALNKYNIKVNETYSYDLQPFEFEPSKYLIGNHYLYFKYIYDTIFYSGQIPNEDIIESLKVYTDNDLDYCILIDQSSLNDFCTGILIKRYDSVASLNKSSFEIQRARIVQKNDNSVIIRTNQNSNNLNIYHLLSLNKNNQIYFLPVSNQTLYAQNYIDYEVDLNTLEINIDELFDLEVYSDELVIELSINLSQTPNKFKPLNSIWIPEVVQVGKYMNNDLALKGEMFNHSLEASGLASHAEGIGTIAISRAQHVQGQFNKVSSTDAFIIGNGANEETRSNLYSIDWEGNSVQSGSLKATDVIIQKIKDDGTIGKRSLANSEDKDNKITIITSFSTNEQYPSAKAVYDYVEEQFASIGVIGGSDLGDLYFAIDGNDIFDSVPAEHPIYNS